MERTGGIDLYALHIGPLLGEMSASAPTSPTLLVQSSDLVRIGGTPPDTTATWRTIGTTPMLTYLSDQQTITEVDPANLQRKVLLRVPGQPLQVLAWTPDGSRLLFVQTQWFCEDCSGLPFPLSRLYVFQPPTG